MNKHQDGAGPQRPAPSVVEVSDVEMAFPASVGHLLPKYEEIPDEFKHRSTKWNKLFSDMFYVGLEKLELKPKPGIDQNKAMRMIRTIMGSWEPKHEHKEAGVAYLLSSFFEDAIWMPAKRKL